LIAFPSSCYAYTYETRSELIIYPLFSALKLSTASTTDCETPIIAASVDDAKLSNAFNSALEVPHPPFSICSTSSSSASEAFVIEEEGFLS